MVNWNTDILALDGFNKTLKLSISYWFGFLKVWQLQSISGKILK